MNKPVIQLFDQSKYTDAYRFLFISNKMLSICYLFLSLFSILFTYIFKTEGLTDIELELQGIRPFVIPISLFILGFGLSYLKNWAFFISSSLCCAIILSKMLSPNTNFIYLIIFTNVWLVHSVLYIYLLINQRNRNTIAFLIFCSFCFYYPVKLFFGI